jgi:hypothetical protein
LLSNQILSLIGVLSYYKSQEDVPVSCRGSISLKVAKLWIDSADRHRFDIVGRSNIRYHLRAEHPMEAKRWVVALTEAKQWLQDNEGFEKASQRKHSDAEMKPINAKANEKMSTMQEGDTDRDAISEHSYEGPTLDEAEDLIHEQRTDFDETFHATMNALLASAQYQEELVRATLKLIETNSGEQHPQLADTFRRSAGSLMETARQAIKMVEERERYWVKRLEKEEELKRVWEDNLRALATEHDELQTKASQQVRMLENRAAKAAASALSLSKSAFVHAGYSLNVMS